MCTTFPALDSPQLLNTFTEAFSRVLVARLVLILSPTDDVSLKLSQHEREFLYIPKEKSRSKRPQLDGTTATVHLFQIKLVNLTSGHFIPQDRSRVGHTLFETKIHRLSAVNLQRQTTSTYPSKCFPQQCFQPKERPYNTVIQYITLHINFQGVSHMLTNFT
jgi:hypothetical protein